MSEHEDHADFVDGPKGERKRTRAKDVQKLRDEALCAVLATQHGRALMAWLLHELCGLYRPTANAAFDPQALHFREGSRAVGLVLHDRIMDVAPDQYLVLMSEHLRKQL